jgi:hypothetical protein
MDSVGPVRQSGVRLHAGIPDLPTQAGRTLSPVYANTATGARSQSANHAHRYVVSKEYQLARLIKSNPHLHNMNLLVHTSAAYAYLM